MPTVDAKHPEYTEALINWRLLRDVEVGANAVQDASIHYLPMPEGFTVAKNPALMYGGYKARARFPEIFSPTITGMVGLIHRREVTVEGLEVPGLEHLWEKCSADGETLEEFHQHISAELLTMGRYAILVDAPADGGDPYLAGYKAEQLINWRAQPVRDLFVLDESGLRQDEDFVWRNRDQWRVLRLVNGTYTQEVHVDTTPIQSSNMLLIESNAHQVNTLSPVTRTQRPFVEIPFVVAGPRSLTLRVEKPPLIGIANSAISIYQLDADYRHQLYMTGQETLFLSGITDSKELPQVVGAGAIHGIPMGAVPQYVGASGRGMEQHAKAIDAEMRKAERIAAAMFEDEGGKSHESGSARALRYAARTASMVTVAFASAKALERALRYAALMQGVDDTTIIVKPDLEFLKTAMTAGDVKSLVDSWLAGAFTYETLYDNLLRGGVASPERNAEEELAASIKEEAERAKRDVEKQVSLTKALPAPKALSPA